MASEKLEMNIDGDVEKDETVISEEEVEIPGIGNLSRPNTANARQFMM